MMSFEAGVRSRGQCFEAGLNHSAPVGQDGRSEGGQSCNYIASISCVTISLPQVSLSWDGSSSFSLRTFGLSMSSGC